MKTSFPAVLLVFAFPWVLLAGCNRSRNENAELKSRVDNLEARQKVLEQSLVDLLKTHQGGSERLDTNLTAAIQLKSDYLDGLAELILQHMTNSALHAKPDQLATRIATLSKAPAVQMRDGVPLRVYNEIAIQAIKEWPRSRQKQENYIRAEVERYKQMHP